MRQELVQRLGELQREFDNGRVELRQLEARRERLEGTMLRISGAMQVLQELLQAVEREAKAEVHPTERREAPQATAAV